MKTSESMGKTLSVPFGADYDSPPAAAGHPKLLAFVSRSFTGKVNRLLTATSVRVGLQRPKGAALDTYQTAVFNTDIMELALEIRCTIDRVVPRDSLPVPFITGALMLVMIDELGRLPADQSTTLRTTLVRGIVANTLSGPDTDKKPN